MKYSLLIWGFLTITLCFYYFVLCITLLFWFVVHYKYPCLLVYVYCRKHALCTTWFLNSPLAAVNQSPVHQTTTIRPGILRPECYRKSTLTGSKCVLIKKKKKKMVPNVFHNSNPASKRPFKVGTRMLFLKIFFFFLIFFWRS